MKHYVKVILWGEPVGYLEYEDESKTSYYEIESTHPYCRDLAPLQLKGNNETFFGAYTDDFFEGLPSFIADSLPDDFGNAVLHEWLLKKGEDFSFIPPLKLSYVGKRAMGAMEYYPDINTSKQNDESIDILELTKISNEILKGSLDATYSEDEINQLFQVGTSAGGARSKAIVGIHKVTQQIFPNYHDDKDVIPSIIKFDGPDSVNNTQSNESGKIEYAYYLMALDCGITMAKSGTIKSGIFEHFVTERFDRGGKGVKHHMLTYSGITGANPRKRHSLEQIYDNFLKLNLTYDQLEQFQRRMIFNVVMANHDCHLKNHAFLLKENGVWELSPAYDVTFPYDTNRIWSRELPISVNGKTKQITTQDFEEVGKKYGIKNTVKIIAQINEIASQWKTFAQKVKLSEERRDIIRKQIAIIH